MPKIFNNGKKIISFLLCLVFAAGSLLWFAANFLKIKVQEKKITGTGGARLSEKATESGRGISDGCAMEEIQQKNAKESDDVLFIGCNGFF